MNKMAGQKTLNPATNKPIHVTMKAKIITEKILNATNKPTVITIATIPVNNKIVEIGSKSDFVNKTCKSNHCAVR